MPVSVAVSLDPDQETSNGSMSFAVAVHPLDSTNNGKPLSVAQFARRMVEDLCPEDWLLRICGRASCGTVRLCYGDDGYETTVILPGDESQEPTKVVGVVLCQQVGNSTVTLNPSDAVYDHVAGGDRAKLHLTLRTACWVNHAEEPPVIEKQRIIRVWPSPENAFQVERMELVTTMKPRDVVIKQAIDKPRNRGAARVSPDRDTKRESPELTLLTGSELEDSIASYLSSPEQPSTNEPTFDSGASVANVSVGDDSYEEETPEGGSKKPSGVGNATNTIAARTRFKTMVKNRSGAKRKIPQVEENRDAKRTRTTKAIMVQVENASASMPAFRRENNATTKMGNCAPIHNVLVDEKESVARVERLGERLDTIWPEDKQQFKTAVSTALTVDQYYRDGLPEDSPVNLLVVSESPCFTREDVAQMKVDLDALRHAGVDYDGPDSHVNLVHCPSYGEAWTLRQDSILDSAQDKMNQVKSGTWKFWKVLFILAGLADERDGYDPLGSRESLKTAFRDIIGGGSKRKTKRESRLRAKFHVLKKLRERGIALVDVSPFSIYLCGETITRVNKKTGRKYYTPKYKLSSKEFKAMVRAAFETYSGPLMQDVKPKRVLFLGKGLEKAIGRARMEELVGSFGGMLLETMTHPSAASFFGKKNVLKSVQTLRRHGSFSDETIVDLSHDEDTSGQQTASKKRKAVSLENSENQFSL